MGCDVHLYVEVKLDGQWVNVPPPARDYKKFPKNPKYDYFWGPHDMFTMGECYGPGFTFREENGLVDENGDYDESCHGKDCDVCLGTGLNLQWFHVRSYNTFAILADVRNGHGFAGIKTGDGFNIIAEPRGLPDDIAPQTYMAYSGYHTESWLTLKEIVDFDWTQTTMHVGVIPVRKQDKHPNDSFETDCMEEWLQRGGGRPNAWCGNIYGNDIVTIDYDDALALIKNGNKQLVPVSWHGKRLYTQVSWEETYAESTEAFQALVKEYLEPLAKAMGVTYDDVRIVFGFDS